ncbi:hypothetical protein Q2431_24885, partial [Escherichia coli]|nr:hypothetical protein [Escherichia coli]
VYKRQVPNDAVMANDDFNAEEMHKEKLQPDGNKTAHVAINRSLTVHVVYKAGADICLLYTYDAADD